MGAYNFMPRFVPMIEDGSKRHTIRAHRRYPDQPGDTLLLYTGMRTPACRKIFDAPCTEVEEIVIIPNEDLIILGANTLSPTEMDSFAWYDGFRPAHKTTDGAWEDMRAWWLKVNGTGKFRGTVTHWNYDARVLPAAKKEARLAAANR